MYCFYHFYTDDDNIHHFNQHYYNNDDFPPIFNHVEIKAISDRPSNRSIAEMFV